MKKEVGYNLTKGGEGVLGYKQSEESNNKNRQSHLDKRHSDDTRQKMSLSHMGKTNHAVSRTKHMNNGKISKMISEDKLSVYLSAG